jgi:hypothetical protein
MLTAAAPMTAYTPSSDRTPFSAFTLADGRRAGFSWDAKPRCIHGHRIPDDEAPITEGIITCRHRGGRREPECGVRIYLVLLTFGGSAAVQGTGERAYLVVEVTRSLVLQMKQRPMLTLERLSVLACVLPGVDVDLTAGAPGTHPED